VSSNLTLSANFDETVLDPDAPVVNSWYRAAQSDIGLSFSAVHLIGPLGQQPLRRPLIGVSVLPEAPTAANADPGGSYRWRGRPGRRLRCA